MTLLHCMGCSDLGSIPFGIIDNAVVLEVKATCEMLISKLISWLIRCDVRCGLYLSISSSEEKFIAHAENLSHSI